MCGIAGVIHRGASENIGREMTAMLQAMKHRGPDSTGFALYSKPRDADKYVMRFKVAEGAEARSGFAIAEKMAARKAEVDRRLGELESIVNKETSVDEYAFRYEIAFSGDLRQLASYIEDIEAVEILSIGRALELVKDLSQQKFLIMTGKNFKI